MPDRKRTRFMGKRRFPFLARLRLHYGIYRRYPLGKWKSLRNAWRIARR